MTKQWQQIAQDLHSKSPLTQHNREETAHVLAAELGGLHLYSNSLSRWGDSAALMAAQEGDERRLLALSLAHHELPLHRQPLGELLRDRVRVSILDVDSDLLEQLPDELPWLRARPNPGLSAIGLGDRLGLATPAHVRALKRSDLFPYLALQSPAELTGSGRQWRDVMGDARWGLLREGYRRGFGADADQLTTEDEIEAAAAAGFVRFTLDLAREVGSVQGLDRQALSHRFVQLEQTIPGADQWRKRYLGQGFDLSLGFTRRNVMFDERNFLVTMVQYGPVWKRYAELAKTVQSSTRGRPFEIELALFAHDSRTTPEAHLFLALEAAHQGLPLHAVAPRFTGRFARCVPYKGNSTKLARNVALHAAIARLAENHRIAIHSGSDKFSVLGLLADATDGNFYLKTSGTSLVEALRVAATSQRDLFEEICEAALATLREGSAIFDLNIDPGKLPAPRTLDDHDLVAYYLDTEHGRHLLCETWAQTLGAASTCRARLIWLLGQNEARHLELVQEHVAKHVKAMMG
jgi:tagaturonate epimerase